MQKIQGFTKDTSNTVDKGPVQKEKGSLKKIDKIIEFFDTNFWIGENNLSEKLSIPEDNVSLILKNNQRTYNISSFILNHFNGFFCNPFIGNNMLAAVLKTLKSKEIIKNVWGCMFLEYEMISNLKDLKDFEGRLKKRFLEGFRLLRLAPRTHKYPYEASLLKKIYKVLSYYKFPVIICLDEIDITSDKQIEWVKILEIAEKFADLPIIIDGGSSKELMFNSYIFLLIFGCSNIYFNTHNLLAVNQIEDIVQIGGEDRLVFDTHFPFYEPFISVDRLLEAELSIYQIEKIASNNIQKIISKIEV